jgi:hypothetical protein
VTVWIAVAALVGLLSESGWAANRTDEWDPVMRLVEGIKAESTVTPRTKQAQELADLVRKEARQIAPKRVVRALGGLMEDRDDSVRYWIATALGYLGPQAAAAIPALEKALKEIEQRPADKTSESAIRLALKRINAPSK